MPMGGISYGSGVADPSCLEDRTDPVARHSVFVVLEACAAEHQVPQRHKAR